LNIGGFKKTQANIKGAKNGMQLPFVFPRGCTDCGFDDLPPQARVNWSGGEPGLK